ncbi:uncharacterized protein LOC130669475 [Microplitis mediator]|uniref:uncharacterized protein LOC130669475 n=1 Tax=Microplitis mediator TaxID=375433 RepID=UPI0025550EE5|nr:uncharacterized protein LOC130669475 [Microplitis mediator]
MHETQRNEAVDASLVVIDKNFKSKAIKKYYPRHPTYVLSTDSIDRLRKNINQIKSSEIWNIASVIVGIGKDCDRAGKVLQMTWKIEALSSYFVCQHSLSNRTIIYTFNPYTDRAPEPWRKEKITNKPNDRWTLYRQQFVNDKSMCSSITFDKTKSLDGYPVKGFMFTDEKDKVMTGLPPIESYGSRNTMYTTLKDLIAASNVTLITYSKQTSHNYGPVFSSLSNRTYDMILLCLLSGSFPPEFLDVASLYFENGFVIVTKKQSIIPAIEQIIDQVFTKQSIIISCVILIFIFMMILLNHKFQFGAAALDLLALILNRGILTPMDRLSMRITFISATLFVLIFNPALQGQLSAVLTRPGTKNVETLRDLRDNNYQVYHHYYIEKWLIDTQLWSNDSFGKQVSSYWGHLDGCRKLIGQNNSVACIIFDDFLDDIKSSDEFHFSKEKSFNIHEFLAVRKQWPLKKKIDEVAMRLVESGFIEHSERQNVYKNYVRKQKLINRIKMREQNDQLDFEKFELFLLFVILSVIWLFLILLFEIMCKKMQDYHERRLRESKMRTLMMRMRMATAIRQMTFFAEQN